jgi:hypothetical protein
MTIARISEGKIAEAWNNFDFMAMFQQLGALNLSAPDAEARQTPACDEPSPTGD